MALLNSKLKMSRGSMDKQVFQLINKLDSKMDSINDKLTDYNGTLGRLTATVEHHVKRSDIADNDRAEIKEKINHIEEDVEGLKTDCGEAKEFLKEANFIVKILKIIFSLKTLKVLIAILGLISSFFVTKYAVRNYKIFKKSTPDYKVIEKK